MQCLIHQLLWVKGAMHELSQKDVEKLVTDLSNSDVAFLIVAEPTEDGLKRLKDIEKTISKYGITMSNKLLDALEILEEDVDSLSRLVEIVKKEKEALKKRVERYKSHGIDLKVDLEYQHIPVKAGTYTIEMIIGLKKFYKDAILLKDVWTEK